MDVANARARPPFLAPDDPRRHDQEPDFSTGHQTFLAEDGRVDEDLVAYHEARARGGVCLIIAEAADDHAARLAEDAGLKVVMNRCPKIEPFRPFWKPRLDLTI